MTYMFLHSGYTHPEPSPERARELQNDVRNFRRIRVKSIKSDKGLSSSAIKVFNDPYLTRYMKQSIDGKKGGKTRKRKYKSKKKNITRKRKQSKKNKKKSK